MVSGRKKLVAIVLAGSVAIIASFGVVNPSQASVHYLFEESQGGFVRGSFEYTAPDFISSDLIVPPNDLDSCVPHFLSTCGNQVFHPSSVGYTSGPDDIADVIGFTNVAPFLTTTSFHYFADGAFGAVGVYYAMILSDDTSRLTVTSDSAPVPEPATLALLGLGLAGLGFSRRKQ